MLILFCAPVNVLLERSWGLGGGDGSRQLDCLCYSCSASSDAARSAPGPMVPLARRRCPRIASMITPTELILGRRVVASLAVLSSHYF